MSDIVERLSDPAGAHFPSSQPDCVLEAADEIERLRAQNAVLLTAINAASALMASAPAWHAMHREAIEQLQKVKKEKES